MLVKKLHTLIFIFLLFFIFSIIGSNIYLFNTALSFRNILFFGLLLFERSRVSRFTRVAFAVCFVAVCRWECSDTGSVGSVTPMLIIMVSSPTKKQGR